MPHTQRIGPTQVLERETDQLYDWVSNMGTGVMGAYDYVPDPCLEFVIQQYNRFNLDFPAQIFEVARVGAKAAFYTVDVIDPYGIFWGVSDVDITDDWTKFAYEITDGHVRIECDAEALETFKLVPGQAESVFSEHIQMPGIKNLPNSAGEQISELLYDSAGEEPWDGLDPDTEMSFRALVTKGGKTNTKLRDAYFEVAAWAAYLWIIGPLGREFRMQHHPIFDATIRHGECILYEANVFEPRHYIKHSRAPHSCYKCGADAWCTQLTMEGAVSRFICESCISAGMPVFPPSNCGSKFCRFAECPHHPYHSTALGSNYAFTRKHGQLVGVVNRNLGIDMPVRKLLN